MTAFFVYYLPASYAFFGKVLSLFFFGPPNFGIVLMHLQALTTLGAWVESFEGGFPLSIFIVQLETLCNNKIAAKKKNIYMK